MDELYDSTKNIYANTSFEPKKFSKRIAFNVIPQIDVFLEDGSTKEEWKMKVETKKILDDSIGVEATCVRVPVFNSHAEAITIECENPISAKKARAALREFEGVLVIDDPKEMKFITPAETSTYDPVYVSRIREDKSAKNALSLWVVADNLRKGAALNAVQIAEILVKDHGF
jgi:aspartate-semialdehyde dehydrogenase